MENIILKFLQKNYPITKIKHGKHFKRGVILDNGSKVFSNQKDSSQTLTNALSHVLEIVFITNKSDSKELVNRYLQKLI